MQVILFEAYTQWLTPLHLTCVACSSHAVDYEVMGTKLNTLRVRPILIKLLFYSV